MYHIIINISVYTKYTHIQYVCMFVYLNVLLVNWLTHKVDAGCQGNKITEKVFRFKYHQLSGKDKICLRWDVVSVPDKDGWCCVDVIYVNIVTWSVGCGRMGELAKGGAVISRPGTRVDGYAHHEQRN